MLNHTMTLEQALKSKLDKTSDVEKIIVEVFAALEVKGYNPVNQIVGYLISGDPAYISNYAEARNKIQQVERDEILEVLLTQFIETSK